MALTMVVGVTLMLLGALHLMFPDMVAGNSVLASTMIGLGLVPPLRVLCSRIWRDRAFRERVLILGASPLTRKLIRDIEARRHGRDTIVGLAADAVADGGPPLGYPILGALADLGKIVDAVRPDRIIVALTERRRRMPFDQLLQSRVCRGIVVEDGAEVHERLTGKLALESLTPSTLIFSKHFRKSRFQLAVRRGFSVLASVIGLVGLGPLLGVIALAIKLDSRGPILFTQERVGAFGKHFKLIKFRTMHPPEGHTSEWARDNSDRITRVGKWLRRFRLDELPQFVNILRGDMNLVGPRPHPVSNFELFELVTRNLNDMTGEKIPYYSLRCAVRPGVTGWAQVRYGYANDLEEEMEKLCYDLYYIKHLSLWLDLRILLETVKIVLAGREVRPAVLSGSPAVLSGSPAAAGGGLPTMLPAWPARQDVNGHSAPGPAASCRTYGPGGRAEEGGYERGVASRPHPKP